ncbi:hypothetical protein [Pseudomonas putida]|uniref:hypothetical protein n=1 Tax=Pseudomonas putida TaxID=303 RepID=UPI0019550466|nr:hypothetical protein [Pseudomonas putida]
MSMWAIWSDEQQAFLFSDVDNGGFELSDAEHAALMQGLESGQLIIADEHGAPVLFDPPPPPAPAIWAKWLEQDGRFLFQNSDNGGVQITCEAHGALLEGQSAGMRIVSNEQGEPVLAGPLSATAEELASNERVWRDGLLSLTDGVVTRHRDELEEAIETTLSPDQYRELQAFRRALRSWPESGEFPLLDHRPIAPPWLAEV